MPSVDRPARLSAKQQAVLALQAHERRRPGPPLHEPIAVIGVACRFPGGGDTPEAFWDFLRQGGDAVAEVPPDRWRPDDYYDPDPAAPGKMSSRWGAFLPEVDRFDARFFNLAPREVANMDPQHRLLLEVTWEALERAGIVPAALDRTPTGVFVGLSTADYARLGFAGGGLGRIDAYYGTGNSFSVAAGRVAYLLGAQGPVFALDTACSSSLVALHQAVQSLRARECALALVGAANLVLIPDNTVYFSKLQALSPDGRCKAFDASANGYVRGEGAGAVVLKRLSAAIRDGDPIAAVIRGTAINHDGPSSGLTVPNGPAQQAVIRAALRDANVEPAHIGFIEAHGTGTPLGDPIEMHALAAVFGEALAPLYVGSVKGNLGHTEAAAGMAGLIKTILALQHHAIPPHLHFREPSPRIEWARLGPIQVPTQLAEWPAPDGGPRFAGVSSFGFSGTNAHVVVEEAPPAAPSPAAAPAAVLLPLSARTPAALRRQARRFAAALSANPQWPLADLAYTAARRRAHHEQRLAVVGETSAALAEQLAAFSLGEAAEGTAAGALAPQRDERVVFVFAGQGPEWPGMGRDLYARSPAFRAVMDECDAVITRLAGWSLRDYLDDRPGARPLDGVGIIHPLLFAMQVGLARQWQAWGLRPAAVVGQSLGELAALCVAGSLSLSDALALMIARSRLIHQLRGQGRMAMVGLSAEAAQAAFAAVDEPLYVAVERSPDSVVVAGSPAAVDRFIAQQQAAGVFCRVVVADIATHCPIADPIVSELGRQAAGLAPQPSTVAFYSTVTGSTLAPEQADADYWQRNLRQPVRWLAAVQALLADGYEVFVEVGPHPALLAAIEQIAQRAGRSVVTAGSTVRGRPELPALLSNVAQLYAAGLAPDWAALCPSGNVLPLPTYAWDRERHWFEPSAALVAPPRADEHTGPAALRGQRLPSPLETLQFAAVFSAPRLPYLTEHRVAGAIVVAGAAHVAQLLEVAGAVLGGQPASLRNVSFLEPMLLGDDEVLDVHTHLAPTAGRHAVRLFSRPAAAAEADPWALHVTALLEAAAPSGGPPAFAGLSAQAGSLPVDAYHAALDNQPYQLSGSFRRLAALWRDTDGALVARFRPPASADERAGYRLHPGLIDSCFQAIGAAAFFDAALPPLGPGEIYVPQALDAFDWLRAESEPLWCRAAVGAAEGGATLTGDVSVYDEAGMLLARISGLQVRRLSASRLTAARGLGLARWFYQMQWQPQALGLPPLPTRGQWLLLADRQGVAEAVAAELRTRGGYPILVFPEGAERASNGAGTLAEAATPAALRRLLRDVQAAHADLRGILHFWGVDATPPAAPLEAAVEAGSLSALFLAQALAALPRPPRLWLVTHRAVAETDAVPLPGVWQAPLWGLGRVLQTEAAELRAGLVDVSGPGDAKALVDELLSGGAENQVVLRGGQRMVARLAPLSVSPNAAPALRPDAAYAITGAFGGLGLAVARWLAEHGARHLLLIGRRPPTPEAAQALEQLRVAGVEVHEELADVAERDQLARAFAALDHLPPLAGVIHAAGTLDDALLPNMDADRFRRVLRAKVSGGWNLHELSRGRPLDFFVLFSSVAAVFGSPGQANHAAASAFLDGLAAHRRGQGLPAVSVSWGPWVGLGAAAGKLSAERIIAGGVAPIVPEVGLALFAQGLAGAPAQPIAMAVDWPRWFQAFPATATAPYLADLAQRHASPTEGGAAIAAQLAALATGPDRRDFLIAFLTRQIAQVLRLPPAQLDPHTPFGSLGFDSLMAVEVKTNLERQLGLVLPVSLVWNYPTLAELAGYLAGELGVSLDAAAPAAPPPAAPDALADLSEADLEALLAAQVARANKAL